MFSFDIGLQLFLNLLQQLSESIHSTMMACYQIKPSFRPVRMSAMADHRHLQSKPIDDVVEEFKQVYKEIGVNELKCEVPYLARLAEHYVQLSQSSNTPWVDLLKVRWLSSITWHNE